MEQKKIINNLYEIYGKDNAKFYSDILQKTEDELLDYYCNNESYENLFFCQCGPKFSWEIEAKILTRRGYPLVEDVIEKLFEWLQDLNWPGADIIFDFLLELPSDVFNYYFQLAIDKANATNDEDWIINLGYLNK